MKGTAALQTILCILIVIAVIFMFVNLTFSITSNVVRQSSIVFQLSSAYTALDSIKTNFNAALDLLAIDASSSGLRDNFGGDFSHDYAGQSIPDSSFEDRWTEQSIIDFLSVEIDRRSIARQSSVIYSEIEFLARHDFDLSMISLSHLDSSITTDVSLELAGDVVPITLKDSYIADSSTQKYLRDIMLASWETSSLVTRVRNLFGAPVVLPADTDQTSSVRVDILGKSNSLAAEVSANAGELSPTNEHVTYDVKGTSLTYNGRFETSNNRKIYYIGLAPENCNLPQEYNKYAGAIEKSLPDRLEQYVDNPRALISAIVKSHSAWNPSSEETLTGLVPAGTLPDEEMTSVVTTIHTTLSRIWSEGFRNSDDEVVINLISQLGLSQDVAASYQNFKGCKFKQSFSEGNFVVPLSGPIIKCYGDPACSGTKPVDEKFYPGIDIYAETGTEIKAVHEGILIRVDALLVAGKVFRNVLIIRGLEDPIVVTIYANVELAGNDGLVKSGDVIGRVVNGTVPHATIIISYNPTSFNIELESTINPCAVLNCNPEKPATHRMERFPESFSVITSPQDYAGFLDSFNSDSQIVLGDNYCTSSNIKERGYRNLGYDFYDLNKQNFRIYPIFDGEVVRILNSESFEGAESWYGCGSAVIIKTTTATGSFLTIYGGVIPVVSVGYVNPVIIGTVDTGRSGLCPMPHLDIRFASENYKFKDITNPSDPTDPILNNACGTKISECNVPPPIPSEVSIATFPFKNHCASLEWEAVVGTTFDKTLVRKAFSSRYEDAPEALRFETKDSIEVNCRPEDTGNRFKWQGIKDSSCRDEDIFLCATPEESDGPNVLHNNQVYNFVKNGVESRYVCRSILGAQRDKCLEKTGGSGTFDNCGRFFPNPQFERYTNWVSQELAGGVAGSTTKFTRSISKFCTEEEDTTDFTCCVARGKTYKCDGRVLEQNEEIRCDGTASCE